MTMVARNAFTDRLDGLGIEWQASLEACDAAAKDFGGIARGQCAGVVCPRNAEEVRAVVAAAREHGVRLTPRALGNSQSGQALAHGGFTLDLSRLTRIDALNRARSTIEAEPAASWRDVMNAALEHGLVPKVMPMNLGLSIGGTLSAGGVGAACHRYGPCAATVQSAVVLTGAGVVVQCSREHNAELFALVLGGQGRCGVLLSVTLELRPTTGRVETAYLLYDSVDACLAQLPALAQRSEIVYAEAYCSALLQGLRVTEAGRRPLLRWFGGLQVTRELDEPAMVGEDWLSGLGWRELIHRETDSVAGFSARYELRFQMMKRSGDWSRAHPWFECFLPPSRAADVIRQALSVLPPFFGDGHRLFAIRIPEQLQYLAMPVPEGGLAVAFAVLPTAIPDWALADALAALAKLDDIVRSAGGKRYLSGWLGNPGADFWRNHHGEHYEGWVRGKRLHDPQGILSSTLFAPLDAEIYRT